MALTVTSRRRSFVLRADARAESQTIGNGSIEVNGRSVAMNSAMQIARIKWAPARAIDGWASS